MAERQFGVTITTSTGRVVPVRVIGEQHVMEDCGFIPNKEIKKNGNEIRRPENTAA
jgi:hypothetical protein